MTFLPPHPHLTPSHTHTCTGHKNIPTPVSREMDQLPVQHLTSWYYNVTIILGGLLQHKKSFHHETQCDGPCTLECCLNYLLVYTNLELVRERYWDIKRSPFLCNIAKINQLLFYVKPLFKPYMANGIVTLKTDTMATK